MKNFILLMVYLMCFNYWGVWMTCCIIYAILVILCYTFLQYENHLPVYVDHNFCEYEEVGSPHDEPCRHSKWKIMLPMHWMVPRLSLIPAGIVYELSCGQRMALGHCTWPSRCRPTPRILACPPSMRIDPESNDHWFFFRILVFLKFYSRNDPTKFYL
jgi:hypothetical protein